MRRSYPLFSVVMTLAPGCVLSGCSTGPCESVDREPTPPPASTGDVYRSAGDPYQLGPLAVETVRVDRCQAGAPVPMLIHAPEPSGDYAVVVFLHGFMARNRYYDAILGHLASHGFVVVAPQTVEPGLGPLFGIPTAQTESEWVARILEWLPSGLADLCPMTARTDRLGLAGHSRGAKVAWLVLTADPTAAAAIAGMDPVDGTGGPFGRQPRVVQGPFDPGVPTLVLGTGLGGRCAPEGDNHVTFYQAAQPPAWHVVATGHGHADMLDEGSPGVGLCPGGPDREGMRRLAGGLMVALFRGALQDDSDAFMALIDPDAAPVAITAERK